MPVAPSTSLGCDDAPELYWTVEMPQCLSGGVSVAGGAMPSVSTHTQDAAPPLCSERTTPHLLSLVGPGPRSLLLSPGPREPVLVLPSQHQIHAALRNWF